MFDLFPSAVKNGDDFAKAHPLTQVPPMQFDWGALGLLALAALAVAALVWFVVHTETPKA